MPESTFSYSHLESPTPGAVLPQGRHAIRGWVWPKPGGHFVDVRAQIGARIFAGVHGIPRADLAAHFQTGRPFALAEFYVIVDLEPGVHDIVLEVLEIEGRWTRFQTLTLKIEQATPPACFAVPGGPLRWIDHGHGLRQLLRNAARHPGEPIDRLAADLVAELPWPRVLRDPPAPLLGFVDEPASVCCCRFGRIPAFGHLFHPTQGIRRILATVDLQSWQPLAIHQSSSGPAAHYTRFSNAQACGFNGLVDVPAQLPNPVSLRIYVELEDGSLQLGPVVRTRLHTQEEENDGGRTAVDFDSALAAWEQALAYCRMNVARDADLDRILAELRSTHANNGRPLSAPAVPALAESPCQASAPIPSRIILATHGLSLQGAPRFLLELGRALAAAGSRLQVVSAEDGPLRAAFESLGATVRIIDCGTVMQAGSIDAATRAISYLAAHPDWAAADLVIANSFTTFWAVHAARATGRPVLFYVHESTTPASFYGPRVPAAVIRLAEESFALADLVSFTTTSTRNCHLGYGRPERHRLTPGWVDFTALEAWAAVQDREALRRELGVQSGEQLVCNIGTVSDRKGQHTFARSVDLLGRRHPDLAARTRFILLGSRDTPFDNMLGDALAELGHGNLVVHPETTDYLRYYLAADLFTCSSYEESSPRVIFEAMALGTPILASAVHGVPELVRDGLEACLLPPGDTVGWSDGLASLLACPAIGRDLAARARARAANHYAASAVLPKHCALIAIAATGQHHLPRSI
ncbi:MAG: Spore coat protein [Verrucomicrobiota bacterium]|jgi:glycosyltransferase involved in cell wall biosynthesis